MTLQTSWIYVGLLRVFLTLLYVSLVFLMGPVDLPGHVPYLIMSKMQEHKWKYSRFIGQSKLQGQIRGQGVPKTGRALQSYTAKTTNTVKRYRIWAQNTIYQNPSTKNITSLKTFDIDMA